VFTPNGRRIEKTVAFWRGQGGRPSWPHGAMYAIICYPKQITKTKMEEQKRKRFKVWHGLLAVILIGGTLFAVNYAPDDSTKGYFSKSSLKNVRPQQSVVKEVPTAVEMQEEQRPSRITLRSLEASRRDRMRVVNRLRDYATNSSERSWILDTSCDLATRAAISHLENLTGASQQLFDYFNNNYMYEIDSPLGYNAIIEGLSNYQLNYEMASDLLEDRDRSCLSDQLMSKAFPLINYEETVLGDLESINDYMLMLRTYMDQ